MTFSNYIDIRLIVEKYSGIIKSSDWKNEAGFRLPIPNFCFEKSNNGLSENLLFEDSLIKESDLIKFKIDNPKVNFIIVYNQPIEYYNKLLSLKFNLNKRNLIRYYRFLLTTDNDKAIKLLNSSEEIFDILKNNVKYFYGKKLNYNNYIKSEFNLLSVFKTDILK